MSCNVIKVINETKGSIAKGYSMRASHMMAIDKEYKDKFSIMSAAFTFGYAQGVKAERARRKRGAAHE